MQTQKEIASKAMQQFRDIIARKTELVNAVESILPRFPADVIPQVHISDLQYREVIIYNLTREQVEATMTAVRAGRWTKKLNPSFPGTLDYTAIIDGITFQIYAADAPPSCRIVEEEIEVPAHKEIKRTLVCHE